MSTQELRKRSNWQTLSGQKALTTEKLFHLTLQNTLDTVYPNTFIVERHPKEFGCFFFLLRIIAHEQEPTKSNQAESQGIPSAGDSPKEG